MKVLTLEEMLSRYILSSNEAITTLFAKELYGFGLTVIYSTIDTLGLLSAPGAVRSASRKTFEPWVAHYLLPHTDRSFNESDLYAARCSVLHSFSTESDLSRRAEARQLHYFIVGSMDSMTAQTVAIVRNMDGGNKHVAVDAIKFGKNVAKAMADFYPDALKRSGDPAFMAKVENLMQLHPVVEPE